MNIFENKKQLRSLSEVTVYIKYEKIVFQFKAGVYVRFRKYKYLKRL